MIHNTSGHGQGISRSGNPNLQQTIQFLCKKTGINNLRPATSKEARQLVDLLRDVVKLL